MNDIHIAAYNTSFFLTFLKAIHPTELNPKADHWYCIYQLRKQQQYYQGYFSSNYWTFNSGKILILEEYSSNILEETKILIDQDVKRHLRIFDLENQTTSRFSKISGGIFSIQKLENDTLIFSKVYYDRSIKYEVNINNLDYISIQPLL